MHTPNHLHIYTAAGKESDIEGPALTSRCREFRPTPLQLAFARAYLWTGSAAEAARTAGYTGRFPAQAGYKLLKRVGTRAAINELLELERLNLRKYILRGLSKTQAAARPHETALRTLDFYAGLVASMMRLIGLGEERSCKVLAYWARETSPRLRRLRLLGGQESVRKV